MIQSAELRPEFKTMIEEARMDQSGGSKMISGVLSGLWQDAKKEELSNVKLKCKFIAPDETKPKVAGELAKDLQTKMRKVTTFIQGLPAQALTRATLKTLRRSGGNITSWSTSAFNSRQRETDSRTHAEKPVRSSTHCDNNRVAQATERGGKPLQLQWRARDSLCGRSCLLQLSPSCWEECSATKPCSGSVHGNTLRGEVNGAGCMVGIFLSRNSRLRGEHATLPSILVQMALRSTPE